MVSCINKNVKDSNSPVGSKSQLDGLDLNLRAGFGLEHKGFKTLSNSCKVRQLKKQVLPVLQSLLAFWLKI